LICIVYSRILLQSYQEELLQELAELEALDSVSELEGAGVASVSHTAKESQESVFSLPVAPSGGLRPVTAAAAAAARPETDDERALRELEASMMLG
jgi:hypothetical protein